MSCRYLIWRSGVSDYVEPVDPRQDRVCMGSACLGIPDDGTAVHRVLYDVPWTAETEDEYPESEGSAHGCTIHVLNYWVTRDIFSTPPRSHADTGSRSFVGFLGFFFPCSYTFVLHLSLETNPDHRFLPPIVCYSERCRLDPVVLYGRCGHATLPACLLTRVPCSWRL